MWLWYTLGVIMAGLGMHLTSVTVPTARGSVPHVTRPPIVYGGLAI